MVVWRWAMLVVCLGTTIGASPAAPAKNAASPSHFDRAVAAARSGRADEALAFLERAFAAGYPTPSVVLTHAAFAPLRYDAPRRSRLNRLLRDHARESRITMVAPGTPGVPLRFVAKVQNARTGAPVPRAFVYLYQTDHFGYYDRDGRGVERGPENARLFGVARTDPQGRIEVRTIVPGSYPGGGFRHIHYFLRADGYQDSMREVILDEDPRPTPQQREWAARSGEVIARRFPGKDKISTLEVVLPLTER